MKNMVLRFEEATKLLKKYKIPIIETRKIKKLEEILNIGNKWGFPLVLKLDSTRILHKTDIGGVITDIQNRKELKEAWQKIKKVATKYKSDIIIQPYIKGVETIVGAKRDVVFGPVIMFGLGGIFVEVFKDVSFRLAPISKKEAKEMIREIKGYQILKGYRGHKTVNIDNLVEILIRVSRLMTNEKNIQEVDLNPVIVTEKGARVVDVKIIVK
jgi:acyl-CoA synthetase (NDP forming)